MSLKCDHCGNEGEFHHGAQCKDWKRCPMCGDACDAGSYMKCRESDLMRETGYCFGCALWELRARTGQALVIEGNVYGLGGNTKPGQFNGMGGRWFDIEYFDGKQVRTCDLWSGGQIPERFRDRIPDTARFLDGAGFKRIGDGGAWNASPNQRSAA